MVHKDINHETLLEQYVADGQSVGAVSSHTFSKLTTGHTIRAEFEPITFTVTFVDGLTGDTLDTQTVAYGKDAAAPQAPQHEGYTFSGLGRCLHQRPQRPDCHRSVRQEQRAHHSGPA